MEDAVRQEQERVAVEEAETPVNHRTLAKALTPPVTIRNFFKPKTSEEGPRQQRKERTSPACDDGESKDDGIILLERETFASKKGITEDNSQLQLLDSKVGVSGDVIAARNSVTKSSSRKPTSRACRTPCTPVTSSKGRAAVKRAGPRTGGSCSKRQKQASLVASFAKGSASVKTKQVCPICQKNFPEGAGNAEINKHVDSCLID